MPGTPKDIKDAEASEASDGPGAPDGSEDSAGMGSKLAKLGQDLEQEDLITLANELAAFYKIQEKEESLNAAGITFNSSSEEELKKEGNKQIGQIVVSTQKEGLPAKGTPLIIFSSNSIQAPKISREGLDIKRIEKIQQEHFINFLQFQADKAKKSTEADENSQPITIEAVGFSPESLNKLLDQIKSNPDIAQNIRIELPEFDKCVHGDGKKYTKEEYDAAQKQIKALQYTAPPAEGKPVAPDAAASLTAKPEGKAADSRPSTPKSPKK